MKNKILFFAMLFMACSFSISVNAQLKVAPNGNVGIHSGDNTPLCHLAIGPTAGLSNTRVFVSQSGTASGDYYGLFSSIYWATNGGWKYGIMGVSRAQVGVAVGVKGDATPVEDNTSVDSYGIYGKAGGGSTGKNYGVFGELKSGSQNGAGVYGTNDGIAQALSARYAGFFRGDTYVNGTIYYTNLSQTSDARLKTNITGVNDDAILKIQELRPVQYQWQQVEDVIETDTLTAKTPHFSEDVDLSQTHYGFLAQDVQKVFPELVKEDGTGYLSMNYIELIPLLVEAINLQQKQIEGLKAEVEELKNK